MKKIITVTTTFFIFTLAHAQTDSLFLKRFEMLLLENSNLKTVLQNEKNKYDELSRAYKKDTLKFMTQLKDLIKDLQNEQEKVTDLNKNKLVVERDNLLAKVDSMNIVISNQIKTLANKDKQIETEKASALTKAKASKNEGKAEAMASILNSYKNRSFDDLIKFSSRESVNRDLPILGDNPDIKPVLNDLLIFFSAQDLLSEKFDGTQIKNAQTQLNQIKHQSILLDAVKEDVEYYKDFNAALKETVSKIVNLDKSKSADGDAEIQELKFKEIVVLLDFLYNYYDYSKYPYLSKIFIEIVKRKKPNADADISDLLIKL